MKTVLDAVREIGMLDNMLAMLQEMEDADPMLMEDIDRQTIFDLLVNYRELVCDMKITK